MGAPISCPCTDPPPFSSQCTLSGGPLGGAAPDAAPPAPHRQSARRHGCLGVGLPSPWAHNQLRPSNAVSTGASVSPCQHCQGTCAPNPLAGARPYCLRFKTALDTAAAGRWGPQFSVFQQEREESMMAVLVCRRAGHCESGSVRQSWGAWDSRQHHTGGCHLCELIKTLAPLWQQRRLQMDGTTSTASSSRRGPSP